MAKLAKKSRSAPDELLEMWREGGTDLQEAMDHSIGLSVSSKLVADNPEALTLLATLSMLPAGTKYGHLKWWAHILKNRAGAIATLSDTALIVDRDLREGRGVLISVIPVVQSYMHQNNRIPATVRKNTQAACYKFILDHDAPAGDPKFNDHFAALASEETNIQAILLAAVQAVERGASSTTGLEVNSADDTLWDVLHIFGWYELWSRAPIDLAERSVTAARAANKKRALAEALHRLAHALSHNHRYSEACGPFKEARECFKTLPDGPDLVRAGQCAAQLTQTYQYMSEPADTMETLILECQDDFRESGSLYGIAFGMFHLGYFYWYRGDNDKGLETLEAARIAFEPIDRPVDVALCLHESARCHASENRYSEALDTIEAAIQKYEQLNLTRRRCDCLVLKARYLKMLDRDDDALELLPRNLETSQWLGSPLLIAQTLEEFGAVYARKRDHRASRAAYEGAQEQFESMSGIALGQEGSARCRHNLLYVALMEENRTDDSISLKHADRY
jgi:tetratricopeptide (TPR) repeat protein